MIARGIALLAVGAAHIDRRGRPSGRFRPAASNPGTVEECVGGSIFNAAVAATRFGASVALFSARGADPEGERVAVALEEAGLRDLAMVWLDRRTPTYTAILDHRGNLVGGIADMALYDLLKHRLLQRRHLRAEIGAADAVMLDANLPQPMIESLTADLADKPAFALGVSPVKAVRLAPALRRLGAVFLSRAEAAAIVEATPNTSVGVLARLLEEAGVRRAVITDGPREVGIFTEGELVVQAPPAVAHVRDVTGAGDTLAGVAIAAFCGGLDFVAAVRLGMAAASCRIAPRETPHPTPEDERAAIAATAADMPEPRPVDER